MQTLTAEQRTRKQEIFDDLVAKTLDSEILAAFSEPHDVDACERVMDAMRFRHGMNYDACVARVAKVVPGADYEAIAQEIEGKDRGDNWR